MHHEITLLLPGAAPLRRGVAAATSAGGSRADGILLPGVAAAAVRLVPVAAGLVVEANAAGIRVAGHTLVPGARRLLRPGERAEVQGAALALDGAAPQDGTRVVAAALLRDAAAGEAPLAGPRLVVLTGSAAGRRHALGPEETVGRGRAATLRIDDPQASRVHVRVRLGKDGATVEDLRSKNGTLLNGVPLERGERRLRPGDELAVGETVLALEDPWTAQPGASHAPEPSVGPAARRPSAPLLAAGLLALSAAALALAGS